MPCRNRSDGELRSWVPARLTGGIACMCVLMAIHLAMTGVAAAQEVKTIDPSGGWKNLRGVLSLMLAGDALSFSFSSVFGSSTHICDGAGVAGLHGDGEYRYVDDQGTVAFLVKEGEVSMRTVSGMASFCGAEWPGEVYTRDGYEPLVTCTVTSPRARFHMVMPSPPGERKGYVVSSDRVETAPVRHERGDPWVLARFKGPGGVTAGLLSKSDLECKE